MKEKRPISFFPYNSSGFTLLEITVVLAIMGFLAAMLYSGAGLVSERERLRITNRKMLEIRRAIVGDPDRFDSFGQRIIGGYVGDMESWPELFEARPEQKRTGNLQEFDPYAPFNDRIWLRRPIGRFSDDGKRWLWSFPRRKLENAADNSDHIGGLETENEGQPVGLWSDDPYGDGKASGRLDSRWRGPYLAAPTDSKPEDSLFLAANMLDYYLLAPARDGLEEIEENGLPATNHREEWKDGDYTSEREYFDDKEMFRLMQTDGRLEDGWHRSLRFFISEDYDRPGSGETIFWIISEGPDRQATYPNKRQGGSGSVDGENRMGVRYDSEASPPRGYNADAPYNQDNIVMKIHSHEWRSIFAAKNARKKEETSQQLRALRRAILGAATPAEGGINNGYTGTLCRWPGLFRWTGEAATGSWSEKDAAGTPYTKGQPRGLWTNRPGNAALAAWSPASCGIGWSGPYLPPPADDGRESRLLDAWGRELLFFQTSDNALLLLSRGADGRFSFGETKDGAFLEPDGFTEALASTAYDFTHPRNLDNVVLVVDGADWQGARLNLAVEIRNVGTSAAQTKIMLVRGLESGGQPEGEVKTYTPTELVELDGDGLANDWQASLSFAAANAGNPPVPSGLRRLIVWNDTGAAGSPADNRPGTGEKYEIFTLPLLMQESHQRLSLHAGNLSKTWPPQQP